MTTPGRFPREWTEAFSAEELERLAIRTVDGEMSDTEAVRAEGLIRRLWVEKARVMRGDRER